MSDKSKLRLLKRAKSKKRIEKESAVRGSLSNLLNKWYQIERLKWFILLVLSLITSILIFPNILSKTKTYHLGDVADLDIKASRDFLIENKELTEKNMEKAVKEVLSVYDFDNPASHLIPRIKDAFLAGREYHSNIQSILDQEERDSAGGEKNTSNAPVETDTQIRNRFFSILEVHPDEGIFDPIMKLGFSDQIEQVMILCISEVFERGVVGNMPMLKDHIEKGGIILHDIDSKKDIPVTNLNRFYDLEGAKEFIETKGRAFINNMGSAEPVKISVTLAQAMVKPNLTFNQRETEARKDLARQSVKPTYYKVKKVRCL